MATRLKILILAYTISPNSGSEPGNSWNLAESLARLGHKVTVVTQLKNKQFLSYDPCFDFIYHDAPIPIHRLPLGTASVYIHYFTWQRSVSKLLRGKIFEDYDVAHHISWGSFWLGTGLANMHVPTVFGPCGYQKTQMKNLKLFGSSWKIEFIRETLLTHFFVKSSFFKKSIRNATLCLSANEQSQQKLMEVANKSSILFMVEGVKQLRNSSRNRILLRDPQNLIWIGRYLPRKGVPLLIKAIYELKKDFPNLHLTLVGDGAELQKVQETVHELNINKMVTFIHRVPNQEIFDLLDKNGLLILPSLRESTGSQIMEAASLGLPTVFFEFIGATTWFDHSTSYIVPVQKYVTEELLIQNLANTIRSAFLADPTNYRNKSLASLEVASRNTWQKKTQDFLNIYNLAIQQYSGNVSK